MEAKSGKIERFKAARFTLVGGFNDAAVLRICRAFSASGYLDRLEQSRQIWRELKEINPRYSPEDHIGQLPFKDPADAERFVDGLRKAGLWHFATFCIR